MKRRVYVTNGDSGNIDGNLQILINNANGMAEIFIESSQPNLMGKRRRIDDNSWRHITVVRYGNTVGLFVDGHFEGSTEYSGKIGESSMNGNKGPAPRFGALNSTHGRFEGFLDDFLITFSNRQE